MMTRYGTMVVHQLPCLSDNYAFILRDEDRGIVATVDTPDADVIGDFLDQQGWGLDLILNTHWHPDHVGGNLALKDRFGATIVGPVGEGDKIPGRDRALSGGDTVLLGGLTARVMDTPGHTLGHIVYVFDDQAVAFVGDTLFSMGCGRLFEGTAEMMWTSISALRALPPETVLHCAHEYTQANAQFALSVDPANEALIEKAAKVDAMRAENKPTVPMRLIDEIAINPFLRADDAGLAARLGLSGARASDVFAEIRRRKDVF